MPRFSTRIALPHLVAELKRRQAQIPTLRARRDALKRSLAEVEKELAAIEGGGNTHGHTNLQTLTAMMEKALRGKTLTTPQLTEAVLAAGYRTSSTVFPRIVAQRLRDTTRFVRVKRGVYTARTGQ